MEHVTEGTDCPCEPTVVPVDRPDGSVGRVIAHHEPNQSPEQRLERAARVSEAIEQVRNDTEPEDPR